MNNTTNQLALQRTPIIIKIYVIIYILLRFMNMACNRVKELPKQLEASNLKFGKQLEASTQNWQNLELLIKKKRVKHGENYCFSAHFEHGFLIKDV